MCRNSIYVFVIIVLFGLDGTHARASEVEVPQPASARALLGTQIQGSNYKIEESVGSDGFLRIYTLTTKFGRYRVESDDMLRVRLRELQALASLGQMSKSQAFTNAAAKAATGPIRFATGLATDPVGTVNNTVTGMAQATALGSLTVTVAFMEIPGAAGSLVGAGGRVIT